MNEKLLNSYRSFVKLVILDVLKEDKSSNIIDIEVYDFDINEHTGKYYPHFLITVGDNESRYYLSTILRKQFIAQKIKNETENFFPDRFNIGQAWISVKKSNESTS